MLIIHESGQQAASEADHPRASRRIRRQPRHGGVHDNTGSQDPVNGIRSASGARSRSSSPLPDLIKPFFAGVARVLLRFAVRSDAIYAPGDRTVVLASPRDRRSRRMSDQGTGLWEFSGRRENERDQSGQREVWSVLLPVPGG